MKFSLKPLCSALLGGVLFVAAPAAHAQVQVNVNVGRPAWGPAVPPQAQYYYIPEIDGYYDLYAQQYIVCQDGYWVPLPELYGYDPYQFHPVVIAYRGREPWGQRDYYHSRYAYRPYQPYYGPARGGYGARPDYDRDHDYRGHDHDNRGYDSRSYNNRGYDAHKQYPGGQNGSYGRPEYPRGSQVSPQSDQGQQGGRAYGQPGSYDQGRGNQNPQPSERGNGGGRRDGRYGR